LKCYVTRQHHYKQKSVEVGIFRRVVGHFECKFQMEGASPTNHCWCQKTRVIALSCGIKISAVHHLVLSQYTHLTDRITTPKTALAYLLAWSINQLISLMDKIHRKRRTIRPSTLGKNQ